MLSLPDGRLVTLPNSQIQENGVVNYSRQGRVRADVLMTLSYGVDIERARAVLTALAADDDRILDDPPFAVSADDLGENGVRILAQAFVRPNDYWAVGSNLRERIKSRFDEEGIRFGVPLRDVTLHPEPPAENPAPVS